MISDTEHYDEIYQRIGRSFYHIHTRYWLLYDLYMPCLAAIIDADFITPSMISEIRVKLFSLASECPEELRNKAREIFLAKNKRRGGVWRDVGLVGAAIEIHAKLARLKNVAMGFDEDSLLDLFNYCVMSLMCIEDGCIKIKIGKDTKTALVTGANGGLGAFIADILDLNGIKVVRISNEQMKQECVKNTILWAYVQNKDENGADYFDFVVNNYGINHLAWLGELEDSDYDIIDANLKTPIAVVDTVVNMNCPNPARILNICSQTYRVAQRCTTVYCASKAGLAHATRVMARELAPKGYVVNGLAPGKILGTKMTELTDKQVTELRGWEQENADKYALSMIPSSRFTTREEVALAVIKILHLPSYINGVIIDMMGGV